MMLRIHSGGSSPKCSDAHSELHQSCSSPRPRPSAIPRLSVSGSVAAVIGPLSPRAGPTWRRATAGARPTPSRRSPRRHSAVSRPAKARRCRPPARASTGDRSGSGTVNRPSAPTVRGVIGGEGRCPQLMSGLIAGALATAAEAAWTRAQVRMLGSRKPVFTREVMVSRMVRAATGHSVDRRVAGVLGGGMRAGYGPSLAVLWTLLRNGRPPRSVHDTCMLGGLIWAFEIAALPAARATPPLHTWPVPDTALDLSKGLLFAAITNATLHCLRLRPRHLVDVSRGIPRRRIEWL